MDVQRQGNFDPGAFISRVDEDGEVDVRMITILDYANTWNDHRLGVALKYDRVLNFDLIGAPVLAGCCEEAISRVILVEVDRFLVRPLGGTLPFLGNLALS